MKEAPDELNRITDVVLAYRPKPKSKAAKKRAKLTQTNKQRPIKGGG